MAKVKKRLLTEEAFEKYSGEIVKAIQGINNLTYMEQAQLAASEANKSKEATETKAGEASTSATNAAASAEVAKKSAEAAAKIVDVGVDPTLSVEGAAADSKTVGVSFGKIQDNYLTFGEYVTLEGVRANNSLYNSAKHQTENMNGFYTLSFVVNEGDELLITGWNSNITYSPTLFKDNTVVEVIYVANQYQDFKVIIPAGVNKLIINGRSISTAASAKKLVINSVSQKFKNDYEERGQRLTNLEALTFPVRVINLSLIHI